MSAPENMTASEMIRVGKEMLDELKDVRKHSASINVLAEWLYQNSSWTLSSCRAIAEQWKKSVDTLPRT